MKKINNPISILEHCSCDFCTGKNEISEVERENLDEICDLYSNYLIDMILENNQKTLLKQ